ncbi:DUF6285 domain-containing protein [Glacieibacterium megasporae]|uniref:DUF6285 domain-containing protein n=1 Tax=Glacieibacterium megasporae TaxID=2835787 RepID=UPI001C1E20DE|nr:DUF6285 domain-containing protein [Polymorphobacter megasporae]UAJ09680.1 DUF6285 domain-containing protein [Polymorphobacter megasporae]
MAGHPSARELVAAVREFIAGLEIEGREGFHAKVAANALAIVERELVARPDVAEVAALASINLSSPRTRGPKVTTVATLGPRVRGDDREEGDDEGEWDEAADLRACVCTALRNGTLTPATPCLLAALTAANLARLAVDNPRYSTFLRRTAAAAPPR